MAPRHRFILRRLLTKLSQESNTLPSCLLLDDVDCADKEPCAIGGFADIFLGTRANQAVALKRLRMDVRRPESEVHRSVCILMRCNSEQTLTLFSHRLSQGNPLCGVSFAIRISCRSWEWTTIHSRVSTAWCLRGCHMEIFYNICQNLMQQGARYLTDVSYVPSDLQKCPANTILG